MLLTLQQFDDAKIGNEEKRQQEEWEAQDKDREKGTNGRGSKNRG